MTDKIMRATHISEKKNKQIIYEDITEEELSALETTILEYRQKQEEFERQQSNND